MTGSGKIKVGIACQGGGAHGAFTWGVLDRLLEEERLEIEGMTGTSAGALNTAAVAQGLAAGGAAQAKTDLFKLWKTVSDHGRSSFLNNRGFIDIMCSNYTMYNSPGFIMFDYMAKLFSPYEFNPLKINPLRDIVTEVFDFELLRSQSTCKVFICATNVRTGKLRIFNTCEMKTEVLLASACLPTIFTAVMVDGEYYWDGGYIGNPVFFPLIYECEGQDIIYIQLNPLIRQKLPVTSTEIYDRMNEINNNSTVIREMRSIAFIQELIQDGTIPQGKLKNVRMHVIRDEETFQELGWSSKLNTEWEFLRHLFAKGRETADKWLRDNLHHVGHRSSVDIRKEYAGHL